jgi:DNA-binding SARP family transcriptional activator
VLVGRRVVAGDPCNEPVHRQLMASYARAGQRHLALLQYQRCREALWTTFRIQPAVETTVLYESLRGRVPQPAAGNARDRGDLPRPAVHAEPGRARVRV